jgi:hypothetical protein
MNKVRRSAIVKAKSELEEIYSVIEQLKDEEQAYYDNMPESLQQSEKGIIAEAAVNELDEAADNIQSAIANLDGIAGECT